MDGPTKILMVEDDVNDAELVRRTLRRGGLDCVAHRADTEQAFRRELSEFAPDVILSDFSMPLFDGMSALAIARHMSPDTPFIFVSGTIGEEYAIRALKNGATDYVLKSDLGRLVPSVERALDDTRIQLAQRQVQEALRHSELRFRLAASTGDVWDWTITSGEAYLSRQWKERLGYQDAEIKNDIGSWLDLLHPEDRDLVKQALKAHTKRREPYDIEFRARCRNGDYRWSHAKGQAVWDETGSASYMAGSVVDITERKQAELKVRRLNRLYAVLSGINALVVRVSQRDDLFREAARIAVEAGQFLLAWIGLTDTDRQRLHVHAWQGVGATYLGDMSMSLAPDSVDQYGIVARAVHERRAVIVEDVMTDSRVPAKQAAIDEGFRSFVVLPLIVGSDVAGVIGLYAAEAGIFDATEMKLLLDMANDIAFAMDHIEKADRLNYLAYYDALTGLPNRSLFHERMGQYVEAARRDGHKLALLAINVDRFKQINDTLGRSAGDDLLKQISGRFQQQAIETGWYARIDADHFAVVVPEVRSEEDLARRVGQHVKDCFGPAFQVAAAELRISVRIGIAMFPADGTDVDLLVRHAEAAGKKARACGETYLFYAQEMSEKIAGALALENKLKRALEQDEFVLYYQPKVDAVSSRILSVEALIRWPDPELGLVPPAHFIPLMEETGLIVEVGAWALKRAVRDHHDWCRLGLATVPRIAVNVSPIQLRRADFVETVRSAVSGGSHPPGIDLEITESLVMEDIEGNIEKLKQVRDLGLGIAIDDFGTGYSSLRYLALLPVQTLKIDHSFIVTMLDESTTMTLVSTVISLAHSLQLKVVAEGVETEAQADCLRALGCDEMQGYLFSRPLPLSAMTDHLLAKR